LVERLWPRGIRKKNLEYDEWLKDVAPSTRLRKWFSHDPEKFDEFLRRYYKEWTCVQQPGSHDAEHNNAVALKRYLEAKPAAPGTRPLWSQDS
jgi:uncharacterized protein YeaO (DUF488 family)